MLIQRQHRHSSSFPSPLIPHQSLLRTHSSTLRRIMSTPRSLFVMLCGAVAIMIILSLQKLNNDPTLAPHNTLQTGPIIISTIKPSVYVAGSESVAITESQSNDDFGVITEESDSINGPNGPNTNSNTNNINVAREKRNAELALIERANIATYQNGFLGIYPESGSEKGGTEITFIFAIQNDSIAEQWPARDFFGGCVIDQTWAPVQHSAIFSVSKAFLLTCILPPHAPGEVEVAFLTNNVTRYVNYGSARFKYLSDSAEKPRMTELAICTVFQDQAIYLREWIAFHTIFGVTKFYLYNQGSNETWKESVKDFIESGLVVPIQWNFHWMQSIRHQAIGFWHNVKAYQHEAKWIAYIDVDEFLFIPKTFGKPVPSLVNFLANFTEFGGVMVDRINFGPNNHLKRPAGLVIENYTTRTPTTHSAQPGKSIVQPKYVRWAGCGGVHTFSIVEGRSNVDGNKRTREDGCGIPYDNVVWDPIRINHYWTKSAEDWGDRLKRDGNPYPVKPEELLEKWKHYFTEEDYDIIEYAEETKRRMLWGVENK